MKKVNLLLGGTPSNLPNLTTVTGDWIGVDHGTIELLDQHITPLISVGDFDSLKTLERQRMERVVSDIRYSNPIKDYTDSQMGVQVALEDLQAEQVDIYGATGGRIDHELVNIFLPLDLTLGGNIRKIRLIDRQNIISYFTAGKYEIHHITSMKYLGFFNLTPVKELMIADAKYRLPATDFNRPVSLSSNEFVQPTVHFAFTEGVVAVIQSKDASK
ncbi:thiamine diphosphokinase [Bombilactobacillus bombi]|uniref:thiamine diphosphokinase n=1 Tax=Bombilactobacillus bombi TaxID=1303590 RepID=UPI0015E59EA0|nr:thiamine diphosphokinase [Bombilactobacillus bombi]MBA1434877.1 thiamine diphosphokinase [Bombilactobacillus bombi]